MSDKSFDLNFNYAYGLPNFQAVFRSQPEDFQVTEIFNTAFSGEGEHLYLWIEKIGENTHWVAKQLAKYYNLPETAIGYCGMKDRHAITQQWFSVHLPGTGAQEMPTLQGNIQVLQQHRHHKKLRRGDHQGNRFVIRLRDVCSTEKKTDTENIHQTLDQKIALIKQCGVPNYFGEQRFGFDGNNLLEADKLLKPLVDQQSNPVTRRKRGKNRDQHSPQTGIYLSAARSYLFNRVLSERMASEDWLALVGQDDEATTGPLWGRGRSQVPEQLQEKEQTILAPLSDWLMALEFTGLSQERRPLQLNPDNLEASWQDQDLVLSFNLEAGQYATAVLREIAVLNSPHTPPVI